MSSWALRNLAAYLSLSGDVTLTPGTGSVVITGQTPVVDMGNQQITPSVGSLVLTGQLADVSTGEITPGAGSLTLTGFAPTVTSSGNVNITPGTAISGSPTPATMVWFSGVETGNINEFTRGNSNGGGGTPSAQTITKRSGAYALLTPHDGVSSVQVTGLAATTFLRAYFFIAGNPTNPVTIIGVGSGSPISTSKFLVWLNADGTVGWSFNDFTAPTASGPNSVLLSAWNLLEVKFVRDTTVGGMEIYLNGVLQVSSFSTNTTSGTSAAAMAFRFGNDLSQPGTNQSGQDIYWDDLAVATGTYIGGGHCVAVQGKSGAPTYDAWSKTGAADAFGCWSQTPFDATKFCSVSSVASRQTMLVDDAAISAAIPSGVINAAFIVCVAKIVSSGNFKITRRLNTVDTDSATKVLSTTDTFEPNGVNGDSLDVFVPSLIDLLTGGMEIGAVANSANTTTVEDMWLLLDFNPTDPASININGLAPTVSSTSNPNITPGTGSVTVTGSTPTLAIIGPLLVVWNDLASLSAILPILWNVTSPGPVGTLPVTWNDVETIVPLPVTWRVIPNLQPAFDASIQQPTATVDETP